MGILYTMFKKKNYFFENLFTIVHYGVHNGSLVSFLAEHYGNKIGSSFRRAEY